MKLFDIVNGKVVMNPQTLAMPEFRYLWDRDDDIDKDNAVREISYVVFLCDESLANPYRAYKEGDREEVLLRDFIKEKKWKADKHIEAAIKKYLEATQTTNSRLLKSAKNAAEKLAGYFDMIDFNEVDKDGKYLFSAKELASNLAAVGNIVKSLHQLEEMVKKEQLETNTVRGGGEIGFYELPRRDFDYGDGMDEDEGL
jgi:hypothetical protein